MTVTYTQKVSECRGFGSFWRLLFRWRGSIYKLVWPDTLVYCLLYFICSLVYRFALNEEQRRTFEHLSLYCDYFRNLIPISFVLGFYVSVVVQRWWEQYLTIPWPDDFALLCTAYIKGKQGTARAVRATLLRYVNLSCVLTFANISPKVHKKFPTHKEMLEAGYITPHEMRILQEQKTRTSVSLATLPLMWSCKVLESARSSGFVRDDFGLRMLIEEVTKLRNKAGMLGRWTDISIPLVYTQVVTLAVYSFFFFSVLGRQFLDPAQKYPNRTIDFIVPIFTLLQFFFYMGWLKVAESLVNPFGEDDDDFDLDLILERHLKMSYLLGDVTPSEDPVELDDMCWDKVIPGMFGRSTADTGLLGHAKDPAWGSHFCMNLEKGDLGRSDLGLGKVSLGCGDPRRGDLRCGDPGKCSPEFKSGGSELETVILTPEPSPEDHFQFLWEEMDLSGPSEQARTSENQTPLVPGSSTRAEDGEQGHGNLGPIIQGNANRGHANHGHLNQGKGYQDGVKQGLVNQANSIPANQGSNNPGCTNQCHSCQHDPGTHFLSNRRRSMIDSECVLEGVTNPMYTD
ncbi:bestrophin-2 [Procambarus clarkii]|uniref:bestrophin-2 n=1 Tax=Procambarus clarkii TaxID=6728 RepID=UPI003742167A